MLRTDGWIETKCNHGNVALASQADVLQEGNCIVVGIHKAITFGHVHVTNQ